MDMQQVWALTWPISQLGTALEALAQACGHRSLPATPPVLPHELRDPESINIHHWLDAVATQLALEVEPFSARYSDTHALLRGGPPAILRLAAPDANSDDGLLVLLRGGSRRVTVLDPKRVVRSLPTAPLAATLAAAHEAPLEAEIGAILAAASVPSHRRNAARAALLRERLGTTHIARGWLLRQLPGSSIRALAHEARLPLLLSLLLGAQVAQYALWLLAWWCIGQGLFSGSLDRGLLLTWALLLCTIIPLRLCAAWLQGLVAIRCGALLKQRLLTGCMKLNPEEMRHQGAGQLLGQVIEAQEIELLALNGGLASLIAITELLIIGLTLSIGLGSPSYALLLAGWLGLAALIAWQYLRQRRRWTHTRLNVTHALIERMVGHRTRLVQESEQQRHQEEDRALTRYLAESRRQDWFEPILLVAIPRGWLIVGMLALAPLIVRGDAPIQLAIGAWGTLFAYVSLQTCMQGLWRMISALSSWEQLQPLVQAAARPERLGNLFMIQQQLVTNTSSDTSAAPHSPVLLEARNLVFQHQAKRQPVLRGYNLRIRHGERLLLEGPSGSGKSTLAAMLSGLRTPDAGLLLLGGLDRQSLGLASWRRRIIAAPQFHENHILVGTFAFNLLMGRRWPAEADDLREAEEICRELGLGPLLDRMPSGMAQMIGDTGWQLSHGEKSRVYIARALLQRADMLVLDESFAALDPENLAQAMRCVLTRAPTLLVIAHP